MEQLDAGYRRAVEQGDISPFIPFEQYEQTAAKIESTLMDLPLPRGGRVEGYSTHFIDRVLGQHGAGDIGRAGMRQGVNVEDILDALEHPVRVSEIVTRSDGLRSYEIYGWGCKLSVNPDTGKLIQVNPYR